MYILIIAHIVQEKKHLQQALISKRKSAIMIYFGIHSEP